MTISHKIVESHNKTAQVFGLQRSGIAATKLLKAHGWNVIASDGSDNIELQAVARELNDLNVTTFLGGHDEAMKLPFDLAIVSPGIPLHAPVIEACQKLPIPIIGELELGYRYCSGRMVAISGSNGKSTTTALLGHIFEKTGSPSFTCGNIGMPLSAIADLTTDDSLLAVEVSSYQLATIDSFKPDIAVLLNITPDHLSWHQGFDNYKQAKSRLWLNFDTGDPVVYFADDENVVSLIDQKDLYGLMFSISRKLPQGAFMDGDEMVIRLPDTDEVRFERELLRLPGRHNSANALAAISSALLFGIKPDIIREGLADFSGLPHRLEFVRELDGVTWINDSKCTNTDAGKWAIEAIGKPIVLIAGGEPKGDGFRMLRPLIKRFVREMILIGEATDEIERDLGDVTLVHRADSLENAVKTAKKVANSADTVILAPFCASFDMFRNFEERGDLFRELVLELQ